MKHIAVVADRDHGSYMPDDGLAVPLLKAAELHVYAHVWDDPAVDLIIVRMTWDYSRRFAEFQAWLDQMAHCRTKS